MPKLPRVPVPRGRSCVPVQRRSALAPTIVSRANPVVPSSLFAQAAAKREFSATSSLEQVASSAVATSASANSGLSLGAIVEGWTVTGHERSALYGVTALTLTHPSTGASLVHLDCDDAHKYFSVNFRTPVDNDMGLPHILEHTTLCGSDKYDVKDPFHLMSKRSLNTDMNATTSASLTSYHFSTMNEADFNNLLSVYLDATFFPKLRKYDFEQEGHRIEPSDPDDPKSKLAIKGIVYNEMKGYLSGSGEHITRALMSELFPGTVYSFSHGGDTRFIPDLTHEQLVAFHKSHYTPENCLFVTYGNINLSHLLDSINKGCLKSFNGDRASAAAVVASPVPAGVATETGAPFSLTARGQRAAISRAEKPAPGLAIRRVRVPPDGYALLSPPVSGAPSSAPAVAVPGEAMAEGADGMAEPEAVAPADFTPAQAEAAARENVAAMAAQSPDVAEMLERAGTNPNCSYIRAWAVGDSRDVHQSLLMRVMLDLLTYGTESPLYHAVIKPGLCSSIAGNTGYDSSTLQPVLMIGGSGLFEGNVNAVAHAISEALELSMDYWGYLRKKIQQATAAGGAEAFNEAGARKIAETMGSSMPPDPFAPLRIQAVMQSIELGLRMRGPAFGAHLSTRIADYWSLGVNAPSSAGAQPQQYSVVEPLRVEDQVAQLRLTLGIREDGSLETIDGRTVEEAYAQGAEEASITTKAAQVLRDLLRSVTVNNSHEVQLVAVPDETLLDEWDQSEATRLEQAEKSWTLEQRKAALASAEAAEERRQVAPAEAAAVLPGVTVDAVSRASPNKEVHKTYLLTALPLQHQKEAMDKLPLNTVPIPIPLQVVSEPTNGLAHLRIVIGLGLPDMVSRAGLETVDADGRPLGTNVRHPWYDLQASNPLQNAMLRIPDQLHAYLPLACGFTGYGTVERPSSRWEIESRLAMGRLSASITTATPTILQPGAGVGLPAPAYLAAKLGLPPGASVTPPLYAVALEVSWLCDEPRSNITAHLLHDLITNSAVANGKLKDRDRKLFSTSIRSAAIETAIGVGESGEMYAGRWATGGLHPISALGEVHGGITQARLLAAIAAAEEQGIDAAAEACRTLVRSLLQRPLVPGTAVRGLLDSLAAAHGQAGGAIRPQMATPTGLMNFEAAGLNNTTATLFPIRAMLTVEPSKSHAVSIGMGMGGSGGVNKVALQKHETQDLAMHLAEYALTSLTLAAPTPVQTTTMGDGRLKTEIVRARPAMPASLNLINPQAPAQPRPIAMKAATDGVLTGAAGAQQPQRTLLHIPGSQVSGLVLALPGPSWGTPDHVAVHLAVSILGSGKLYEAVREIGGAYDVSARVGSADEIIISTSEDPTPLNTLQTLREAVAWLCDGSAQAEAAERGGSFTAQDLEEAKLSLFSEIDSPVAPESKGLSAFIYGVSQEARQQYRQWMFDTTRAQVIAAARRWIQVPLEEGRYAVAIAGDAPKLKKQLNKAAKAAGLVEPSAKQIAKAAAAAPAKPQALLKNKPKAAKPKIAPVVLQAAPVQLPTVKGDVLPSAWAQMEVLVRGQGGPKMQ